MRFDGRHLKPSAVGLNCIHKLRCQKTETLEKKLKHVEFASLTAPYNKNKFVREPTFVALLFLHHFVFTQADRIC